MSTFVNVFVLSFNYGWMTGGGQVELHIPVPSTLLFNKSPSVIYNQDPPVSSLLTFSWDLCFRNLPFSLDLSPLELDLTGTTSSAVEKKIQQSPELYRSTWTGLCMATACILQYISIPQAFHFHGTTNKVQSSQHCMKG